jgi:hypothetical protein
MSESADVHSQTATRLEELIKRSAELAKEMKVTSEKMEALTKQMAEEAGRKAAAAHDARERQKKE